MLNLRGFCAESPLAQKVSGKYDFLCKAGWGLESHYMPNDNPFTGPEPKGLNDQAS